MFSPGTVLVMDGSALPRAVADEPLKVRRHRTAMRRYRCSRPVALALADGIIARTTTIFDYGCGHGADVRYLQSRRIKAKGWDPHYQAKTKVVPADVVNLGYVLNVIEDPRERVETLRHAFSLANQALIVAVRVDCSLEDAAEFGDGQLTGKGTFQKIFTQAEFREYVESALGRRPHAVALGVAYVFKDEEAEARYVATRAFTRRLEYRTDLIEEFARSAVARRYVQLANKLGRVPLSEEFPAYSTLLEAFGSQQRIERLTLRHVNRESFEGSRAQRRQDILTYLAMLRLQGLRPPPFGALPASVRGDLKALWKTYSETTEEAGRFLFSIGTPEVVRGAFGGPGWKAPSIRFLHPSIR